MFVSLRSLMCVAHWFKCRAVERRASHKHASNIVRKVYGSVLTDHPTEVSDKDGLLSRSMAMRVIDVFMQERIVCCRVTCEFVFWSLLPEASAPKHDDTSGELVWPFDQPWCWNAGKESDLWMGRSSTRG